MTCLTAIKLDGKVLWQIGKPDPRNALLTYDLPFQIHDIDGDGRNEVVLIKDFKLQVLDGRTGKLREKRAGAHAAPQIKNEIYDRVEWRLHHLRESVGR